MIPSPYSQTQFDLNFTLLGVPIRVQPLFWLVTILLGWGYFSQTNDLSLLGLWVIAVFISILIHEFGHIFAGKAFGTDGYIILHGFGGMAVGSTEISNRWKRILITLAGPGAQLIFLAILIGVKANLQLDPTNPTHIKISIWINMLANINYYWPILNLIPVFPLDGGQIMRDFLNQIRRGSDKLAFQISLAAACVMILYFANNESYYLVFLFVMLAMQNLEYAKQS